MTRNFNSRLHRLESHRREYRRPHRLDCVELYPDGREVFLYSYSSTADFNKIVIVVPKESEGDNAPICN